MFGGAAVLIAGIGFVIRRAIIKPLTELGAVAGRSAAGDLHQGAGASRVKEIDTIAQEFNQMAEQLIVSMQSQDRQRQELAAFSAELEAINQRQAEAARQLEIAATESQRRANLLQASARVSQAIAQIHDQDILLSRITKLISQHFGYYHVGIFLVDKPSGYAVLRATNSPGGQKMLARQHRLHVGSEGIVGYVTGTGQPRIALDVGIDAVHLKTAELPDTRSEMAVPLRIGDDVAGALDVQSDQEAAFGEEEIDVLASLADQIATAIQNAQLYQQTQATLVEIRERHRQFVRDEWEQFLTGQQVRPTNAVSHIRQDV
jgi:putative methionine-R-sulfoxide reductase with GAF domain